MYILSDLLKCGVLDIKMLDNCNYDSKEIKENINGELSFNSIIDSILYIWIEHLQAKIDNEIEETTYKLSVYDNNCKSEYDYLKQKLEDLKKLDIENDIETYNNYIDTSIYILDNENKKIYQKYFSDFINEENDNIGILKVEI